MEGKQMNRRPLALFLSPLLVAWVSLLVASGLFPTSAHCGEYLHEGTPVFRVVYPDNMTTHPENPRNLPLRLGTNGSLPILEANVLDIPENAQIETISERVRENASKATGSDVEIKSEEMITLACGTPARATLLGFLFQGWMPLDIYVVSAFKDEKWVNVQVIQSDGQGITEPAKSLEFK